MQGDSSTGSKLACGKAREALVYMWFEEVFPVPQAMQLIDDSHEMRSQEIPSELEQL